MSFAHADASKKAIENLIHASANPEEAAQEIKLWFGK
jgi:nucleoside diphosphate kinase